MTDKVTQYLPDEVSPPGDTLKDVLEDRGVSQADLALRMGRPQKTISEIVNAKAAITPETALGLELVLGISASFWLARESAYREFVARTAQAERLADDRDWAKLFPLGKMRKLGYIPASRTPRDDVRCLLEFFGVASPTQWHELYAAPAVSFRRSSAFESDHFALSAWLRLGMLHAQRVRTEPFDRDRFLGALTEARGLTRSSPDSFVPGLQSIMAAAGVSVAFVPELPGSRASGATRWITPTKAHIQLSLRYKSEDQLWFTFFHEAAHVLLHGKKDIFIDGQERGGLVAEEESEANEWAADFLIPPAHWHALSQWPKAAYTKAAISRFAEQIGVSAGIVVGRLQHARRLPFSHLNDLKQRLVWVVKPTHG